MEGFLGTNDWFKKLEFSSSKEFWFRSCTEKSLKEFKRVHKKF